MARNRRLWSITNRIVYCGKCGNNRISTNRLWGFLDTVWGIREGNRPGRLRTNGSLFRLVYRHRLATSHRCPTFIRTPVDFDRPLKIGFGLWATSSSTSRILSLDLATFARIATIPIGSSVILVSNGDYGITSITRGYESILSLWNIIAVREDRSVSSDWIFLSVAVPMPPIEVADTQLKLTQVENLRLQNELDAMQYRFQKLDSRKLSRWCFTPGISFLSGLWKALASWN